MNQEVARSEEALAWAQEAQDRLATILSQRNGETDDVSVDWETLEVLTEALDAATALAAPVACGNSSDSCDVVEESINRAFAHWQARISLSLSEAATEQLATQLSTVSTLTASLEAREQQLIQREQALESKAKEIETRFTDVLIRESRTMRQRNKIAAQLRSKHLEGREALEKQRDELELEIRAELHSADAEQLSQLAAQLDEERERFSAAEVSLADEVRAHAESRQMLEGVQKQLDEQIEKQAESLLKSSSELEEEMAKLQSENEALLAELEKQQQEFEAELDAENAKLIQQITKLTEEVEASSETASEDDQKVAALQQELEETKQQLQSVQSDLQQQLEEAKQALEAAAIQLETIQSDAPGGQTGDVDSDKQQLLNELEAARQEIEDLRKSNGDLAIRIAAVSEPGTRPHVNFNQESLSWEERKKLMMQQLEDDDSDGSPEDQASRLEMQQVLERTQAEIDRRDREIEELQSIIEQQSDTKQGVAIGAAAIAQMFESDDLIREERQKLKEIQAEWEGKLRQAEIDISMERAKLARERSEIEIKMQELESRVASSPVAAKVESASGRTRKWLDHLGLREDREDGTK